MYCYSTLKANAKRRGKEFTISFSEFKEFCYKTDYLRGKGKRQDSYSIDRIDNDRGYTLENIRVLSIAENSRKGAKVLQYDWETKFATVSQRVGGAITLFKYAA